MVAGVANSGIPSLLVWLPWGTQVASVRYPLLPSSHHRTLQTRDETWKSHLRVSLSGHLLNKNQSQTTMYTLHL